jgi:hypothetical protein
LMKALPLSDNTNHVSILKSKENESRLIGACLGAKFDD